jgi:hypothetical protein
MLGVGRFVGVAGREETEEVSDILGGGDVVGLTNDLVATNIP